MSSPVSFKIAASSCAITALKAAFSCHSGRCGASSASRSHENTISVYIGCSTQVVPSSSNVAIRSSTGTNRLLDVSVVARTNSRIPVFAAPPFHEGNASSAPAKPQPATTTHNATDITKRIDEHPSKSKLCTTNRPHPPHIVTLQPTKLKHKLSRPRHRVAPTIGRTN